MLACIPTKGNAGLEDTVSDHFGSAPYFALYDTKTEELKIIENRNAHHDHGTCHPMNQLARYRLDCIVCSGMGRRAIEALMSEGIIIYQAESDRVSDIIEALKNNGLAQIDPAQACRGHGQRHKMTHIEPMPGRGHGYGPGQGGGRGQGRGGGRGSGGGWGQNW